MLIKDANILITRAELKQSAKNNSNYLAISFVDLGTGQTFDIIDRNIERIKKINVLNKYKVDLILTSNKYGMTLSIDNILEHLGAI